MKIDQIGSGTEIEGIDDVTGEARNEMIAAVTAVTAITTASAPRTRSGRRTRRWQRRPQRKRI